MGIWSSSFCFGQEIVLVRHAKVDMHVNGLMGSNKAAYYSQAYDTTAIVEFFADTVLAKLPERTTDTVYTSILFRSMATAGELYGDSVVFISSPVFNEFEMSILKLPLVLSYKAWASISRATWLLGRKGKDAETYSEAKQRVIKNVLFLEEKAGTDKQVILVAHGFINRNIKNQLLNRGWKLKQDQGLKNLGAFVLQK